MDPEVEEAISAAARALPPEQRAAHLDQACAGDPPMRQGVEPLAEHPPQAGQGKTAPAPPPPGGTILLSGPLTEKPGDRIGHYKLLQEIGEGGCGLVYMAEQQEPIRRKVALKVIKLGMDTKVVIARFEAERQALALMDHPNIAKVLDAGATHTGRPYFVMELVQGIKLTDYCDQHHLLIEERLELFIQVTHALQHAHQKGIIHRDIKPSNILVTLNDGVPVPKVIDFGIAKAASGQVLTNKTLFTALEQFMGTPAYMSPEQAEMTSLDIDTRSDIYSLGVLLYELLTGHTPFEAETLWAAGLDGMRRLIRETEPPRPSTRLSSLEDAEQTTIAKRRQSEPPRLIHQVQGDLDWIVMKCLEKDRTRRYETANGLAMDIKRHLNHQPVSAVAPSTLYRARKFARRHKVGLAMAGALLLLLVAGVIVSTWQAVRATRAERDQARLHQTETQLRKQAEAARVSAEEAREQMLHEKRLAQHASYVATIGLADRFIGELRYDDARQMLAGCAAEFRGWEWRRLWFLCHMGSVTLAHGEQVWGIAFSPDNRYVATAAYDNAVRIWDCRTGAQQQRLSPFTRWAQCVSYSPDGRYLAAGSWDGTGRIWETENWQQVARLDKHDDRIFTLAYSPDGATIATGGGNNVNSRDDSIRLWDARDGRPVARLEGHQGCVYCVRFDPRGRRLSSSGKDGVRIWNLTTLAQERQLASDTSYSLAYTPDGRYLAFGAARSIKLLDLETGNIASLPTEDTTWSVAISSDGQHLVAGQEDKVALLVKLPELQVSRTLKGHSAKVVAVTFSPDCKQIGTASSDGAAKVWPTRGVPDRRVIRAHTRAVHALAFSPDGGLLASAGEEGAAKLWDLQTQSARQTWTADKGPAEAVAFSGDGSRLAVALGYHALVWDLKNARELCNVSGCEARVRGVALSQDGRFLVTACWEHQADVWNADTGDKLGSLGSEKTETWSVAARPHVNEVATGGRNPTVGCWDLDSRQILRTAAGHQRTVNSVVFSPRGDLLASAGWDGFINILDAANGHPVSHIKGLPWAPVSTAFSPDSRRLVSAAGHTRVKELRVWEVETGIDLLRVPGDAAPLCVSFSPDGDTIASGSEDGAISLWLTEPRENLARP
jgi:WD40 repeat protein/serine/threonine protein kinase